MASNKENLVQYDSRLLGEMCYRAACEKAKHLTQTIAPIEIVADSLAEGTKTAQRFRKGLHRPDFDQVLALIRDLKDSDVKDFLIASIENAFKS